MIYLKFAPCSRLYNHQGKVYASSSWLPVLSLVPATKQVLHKYFLNISGAHYLPGEIRLMEIAMAWDGQAQSWMTGCRPKEGDVPPGSSRDAHRRGVLAGPDRIGGVHQIQMSRRMFLAVGTAKATVQREKSSVCSYKSQITVSRLAKCVLWISCQYFLKIRRFHIKI